MQMPQQSEEKAKALADRLEAILANYSSAEQGYALSKIMAEFLSRTAIDPEHFFEGIGIVNEKMFSEFKRFCKHYSGSRH
jgi:hypothetical protein